jgi:hypothetical protein
LSIQRIGILTTNSTNGGRKKINRRDRREEYGEHGERGRRGKTAKAQKANKGVRGLTRMEKWIHIMLTIIKIILKYTLSNEAPGSREFHSRGNSGIPHWRSAIRHSRIACRKAKPFCTQLVWSFGIAKTPSPSA